MRIRHASASFFQTIACVAAIVLIAACAANNGAGKSNVGMNGQTKAQSYRDDGFLGTTNSYPHIPGRHMTLNYANDANMMRDAIADVPGVAGANITFSGAEAFVTVKIRPDWDARRVSTVERQAASVLRFNFPRYTIHVTSTRQ